MVPAQAPLLPRDGYADIRAVATERDQQGVAVTWHFLLGIAQPHHLHDARTLRIELGMEQVKVQALESVFVGHGLVDLGEADQQAGAMGLQVGVPQALVARRVGGESQATLGRNGATVAFLGMVDEVQAEADGGALVGGHAVNGTGEFIGLTRLPVETDAGGLAFGPLGLVVEIQKAVAAAPLHLVAGLHPERRGGVDRLYGSVLQVDDADIGLVAPLGRPLLRGNAEAGQVALRWAPRADIEKGVNVETIIRRDTRDRTKRFARAVRPEFNGFFQTLPVFRPHTAGDEGRATPCYQVSSRERAFSFPPSSEGAGLASHPASLDATVPSGAGQVPRSAAVWRCSCSPADQSRDRKVRWRPPSSGRGGQPTR